MTNQCNCPQCQPHLYRWSKGVPYQKRSYGPVVSVAGIIIIAMFLVWIVNTGYFDSLIGFAQNLSAPTFTVDNTPALSAPMPQTAGVTTSGTKYTLGETTIISEDDILPMQSNEAQAAPPPVFEGPGSTLDETAAILAERGETLSAVQPNRPEERNQPVYFFKDMNGNGYEYEEAQYVSTMPVLINGEIRDQIGIDGGLWVFSLGDSVYINPLNLNVSLGSYPIVDGIVMVDLNK